MLVSAPLQVYKAMHNLVEPVALKLLGSDDEEVNPEVQARAIRELELLRDCRNPHIVQFLGASIMHRQIAIVTELMPLGDLHTALSSRRVQWGPRWDYCFFKGIHTEAASVRWHISQAYHH